MAIILLVGACASGPKEPNIAPIIGRLHVRMADLSRKDWMKTHITPAYAAASQAVVQQTATDLRTYLEQPGNRAALTSGFGRVEFRSMVQLGLAEIVEVLLSYPETRAFVDEPRPDDGLHLWSIVSLGGPLGVQACGRLNTHFGSYRMGHDYYLMGYYGPDTGQTPYLRVRQMLEAAGAKQRPLETKALWLTQCDLTETGIGKRPGEPAPGVRQRIADAPDILDAIIREVQSQVSSAGQPKPDHYRHCRDYYGTC